MKIDHLSKPYTTVWQNRSYVNIEILDRPDRCTISVRSGVSEFWSSTDISSPDRVQPKAQITGDQLSSDSPGLVASL
jgi:hypothetical protein